MRNRILAAAILVAATVTITGCKKPRRAMRSGRLAGACARRYRSVSNQALRLRYAGKVKRTPMPSNRTNSKP